VSSTIPEDSLDEKKAAAAKQSEALKWLDRPAKTLDVKLTPEDEPALELSVTVVEGFVAGTPPLPGAADLKLEDEKTGALVTVDLYPIGDTLEGIKKGWEGEKATIVKSEEQGTGFVVAAKFDGWLKVKVGRKIGERDITCFAETSSEFALQNPDKILPWLEKLCSGVQPKGGAPAPSPSASP
jgi:hypothetical protein